MLKSILNLMKTVPGPLSITSLSQRLKIDEAVLEGMLQTLERKGKIRGVEGGKTMCASCPLAGSCAPSTKSYTLVPTDVAPTSP